MARALSAKAIEKVWGRERLPPPFAGVGHGRIGEIWFEPPPELPELLVKYLFTSEALSVQVHPSDADAPEGGRGKDECWLILSADPGARIAMGFREPVSPESMRASALDGSIEDLLEWFAVAPGDFIYLPAGTVHAIGAGIALIEIQQNSNVTYRLYDYGRPRALHTEEAIAVADGRPHSPALRRRIPDRGPAQLVDGPCFRLELVDGPSVRDATARFADRPALLVPLDEEIYIGGVPIAPGGCGLVGDLPELEFSPGARVLVAQPV